MATVQEIIRRKVGFFDYNDLTTATTPISVTGGGGYVDLTNDGAGSFTNLTYKPTSMTTIYNTTTDLFDWSELALGDELQIRLDVEVVTSSVNTEFDIQLLLANGGSSYGISWVNPVDVKSASTNPFIIWNGIYMGDANTLNNTAKFQMKADKTCTVKVNGWYVSVHRR